LVERLETRWLFSMTLPTTGAANSESSPAAHAGGCGCPLCGGLSGFVQADSTVLPPLGTDSAGDSSAPANSSHGGGCGCPLCQAALESSAYGADALVGGASTQFVKSNLKWSQPGGLGNPVNITYSLSNLLTSDLGGTLSPTAVYDAVEEALGLWARYAPLQFTEVLDSGPGLVDAGYSGFNRPNIRFGHHAIDGRNNVLAHAYLPDGSGLAGDVHLDSGDTWSTQGSFNSIDIIEVLTHELGHSLGLNHEEDNDAIMNAFYGSRYDGPGTGFLLPDDINGIRAIYGMGIGFVTPLPREPAGVADAFSLDEDVSLAAAASVLANDSDPNGLNLVAVLATGPVHGALALNADGTFTYAPDDDFFGEDTFTYRASNGTFESSVIQVTLTVRPILDLPVALPDAYTVRTGDALRTGIPAESVVETGSSWRFLDDGTNQDLAWRDPDFDDSSWSAGNAQLGYGDGDEQSLVGFGGNSAQKFITTYFRHEFELKDVARVDELRLALLRDDGAAVYLNGTLLLRSNMPVAYDYLTPATTSISGSAETRFVNSTINAANLNAGTLREGRNVLAVEMHQANGTSEDLSFDLSLSVTRDVTPNPNANDRDSDRTGLDINVLVEPAHGTLTLDDYGAIEYVPLPGFVGEDTFIYRATSRTAATFVAPGSSWSYLDTGTDLGTTWFEPTFVEEGWKLGRAQLGYGDDDEGTTVESGEAEARIATTYFRKTFTLEDSASVLSLAAEVLRDDAAAIYLNGVEIYRDDNLQNDAAHDDYAAAQVDDENAFVVFTIPVELLESGENVLAVEIHQASATDDDLSFDLLLAGHLASQSTTVTIDVTPTLSGDVNFDGSVDVSDLNLVRNNFGGDATILLGDSNGDGSIGIADLNAVRNNFGASAPAPMAARLASSSVTPGTMARGSAVWDLALVEWLDAADLPLAQSTLVAKKKLLAVRL